jgi:hypothetical protein
MQSWENQILDCLSKMLKFVGQLSTLLLQCTPHSYVPISFALLTYKKCSVCSENFWRFKLSAYCYFRQQTFQYSWFTCFIVTDKVSGLCSISLDPSHELYRVLWTPENKQHTGVQSTVMLFQGYVHLETHADTSQSAALYNVIVALQKWSYVGKGGGRRCEAFPWSWNLQFCKIWMEVVPFSHFLYPVLSMTFS